MLVSTFSNCLKKRKSNLTIHSFHSFWNLENIRDLREKYDANVSSTYTRPFIPCVKYSKSHD